MQSASGTSAVVESSARPSTRTSPVSWSMSPTSSTQHADQSAGASLMRLQNSVDTLLGTVTPRQS
eukprot:4278067-Prorocentrum_lima.AAC.1